MTHAAGTEPITADRALLMIDEALDRHTDRVVGLLDERLQETERKLLAAFPDQDPHGHRKAHEKYIDKARKCATFKEQFAGHVATWGLMAAIGWMVLLVWEAIKREVAR